MPWICRFSLDRACVPWNRMMQDGNGEHGERQRPLGNARANDSQERHHSRPQDRVRVNILYGLEFKVRTVLQTRR